MRNLNNNKIGIFDSGIGGVTVLKEIIKLLPNENYIYYSDSKNNPYGDKEDKEIIEICDKIVNNFIEQKCKAIVIACNTASAKAAKTLREKYTQIPIIAIEPAYKMVHDFSYDKVTLVMATKATIESEKFQNLYKLYNNHKTILYPCVGLAELIEENNQEKIEKYLNDNLKQFNKIDNVVLGCTHYPLIKKQLNKVLNNPNFFDGGHGISMQLKRTIEKYNIKKSKNKIEFFDSSNNKLKKERFFEILKKTI